MALSAWTHEVRGDPDMTFGPLRNRILVRHGESNEKTDNGIIVRESPVIGIPDDQPASASQPA